MSRFEQARVKQLNKVMENKEISQKEIDELMLKWTKKYLKDVEYRKQYYLKNKEKIQAAEKQYRIDNREKVLARKKAYRQKNKEKIKSYKAKYNLKKKEEMKNNKIKCEVCGALVRRDNYARHCKSKKHQKHLISMTE